MQNAIIIESVPNFSEGKRQDVVDRLNESVLSVPGTRLLRSERDVDHNRSVLTMIGDPESVLASIFNAAQTAVHHIDMNEHTGVHPRIGSVDVIPIIPIAGITDTECNDLAHRLGERLGRELSLPVYLYGKAASNPDHENLAEIRRYGYEGLSSRMNTEAAWRPDYGPSFPHPTAGAVAVGVRPPLIAYNINLDTSDVAIARRIASKIRERDGGLPCVKALGLYLEDRGIVQVSMNLMDYKITSVSTVFEAVCAYAVEEGVPVLESELIGLINLDAVLDTAAQYLKLKNITADRVLDLHTRME